MAEIPNTMWIFDSELKQFGGGVRTRSGMGVGGINLLGVAEAIGEAKFAYDQAKSGNLQKQQGSNKPVHTFEGTLDMQDSVLVLKGKSVQGGDDVSIQIPYQSIRNASVGFDTNYHAGLVHGAMMGGMQQMGNMGMGGMNRRPMQANRGMEPLKIEYQDQSGKRSVYIFANYNSASGMTTTANGDVLNALKGRGIKSGFHLF